MFLKPISTGIPPIKAIPDNYLSANTEEETALPENAPTFFDVFSGLYNTTVETNQQKAQDVLDVVLGNVDDLETVTANIQKAQVATDLFVTVKNSIVEAYNEIIKMQI